MKYFYRIKDAVALDKGRKHESILVISLLSCVILIGNYQDVFLSKTMYVDDHHRYILGMENKIHKTILERNALRAYVIFPLYKLLSINLSYARFAQCVFFYIPLAVCVYYLLRMIAGLSPTVAFFSSVLPCILPGQWQIPSFIDGSYTVQGLLVFLGMLFASYRYIRLKNNSWVMLGFSVFLYAASLEMMDHSLFLLPWAVVSYFLVGPIQERTKRILAISLMQILVAGFKSILILIYPTVPAAVPIEPSWNLFIERLTLVISDTVSFSYNIWGNKIDSIVVPLIFIGIVVFGLILGGRRDKILIVIGLLWFFFSSILFLTFSRFYSSRYAHIGAFGINFVIVISIWIIFNNLKLGGKKNIIPTLVLFVMMIHSGVSKGNHQYKFFAPQNKAHEAITAVLKKIDFPLESQVIITNGQYILTGEYWTYSSGYMKYASGRADLTGIIGRERSFYDPFDPKMRRFEASHRMTGIDLEKPVFLFRLAQKEVTLKQLEYVLQWLGKTWHVYRYDIRTGNLVEDNEGEGFEMFKEFRERKGLTEGEILFAFGEPS